MRFLDISTLIKIFNWSKSDSMLKCSAISFIFLRLMGSYLIHLMYHKVILYYCRYTIFISNLLLGMFVSPCPADSAALHARCVKRSFIFFLPLSQFYYLHTNTFSSTVRIVTKGWLNHRLKGSLRTLVQQNQHSCLQMAMHETKIFIHFSRVARSYFRNI